MKKLILLLASVFILASCSDDDEKTIKFEEIPANAQSFVKQHFDGLGVVKAQEDKHNYEVTLGGNVEVKFDKNGNWYEIDLNGRQLPVSIAQLLPTKCLDYISVNHPTTAIEEIEKKSLGNIKIELVNDIEIMFDAAGNFLYVEGGEKAKPGEVVTVTPEAISAYVLQHFPEQTIVKVVKDLQDKEYEVDLNNKVELEFDLEFKIKSVEMPDALAVPSSVMLESVQRYVTDNYPGRYINEFEVLPSYFGVYAGGCVVELNEVKGKADVKIFFNMAGALWKIVLED